jgi:hypothetical protein
MMTFEEAVKAKEGIVPNPENKDMLCAILVVPFWSEARDRYLKGFNPEARVDEDALEYTENHFTVLVCYHKLGASQIHEYPIIHEL